MQPTDHQSRIAANSGPAAPFLAAWARLQTALADRRSRDEQGASIAEVLAYTALSVAALVALFALFNALGADVVTQVRRRLGLGG